MPKQWSEIESTSKYQDLPVEEKNEVRKQYFQKVIQPNVPPEEHEAVLEQFEARTIPKELRRTAFEKEREKLLTPITGALAGAAAFPGTVIRGGEWLGTKGMELATGREAPEDMPSLADTLALPTYEEAVGGLKKIGLPYREAETPTGRIAQKGAEFLLTMGRSGVTTGLAKVPGLGLRAVPKLTGAGTAAVASGVAQQSAAEAGLPPALQIAAGFLAPSGVGLFVAGKRALVGGGAKNLMKRAVEDVSKKQMDDAASLYKTAQKEGVPITWAEALGDAAPEMAFLQRAVEESPASAKMFNKMMSQRAGRVESKAKDILQRVGKEQVPQDLAARVNKAAFNATQHLKKGRSAEVSEGYKQMMTQAVPEGEMGKILKSFDAASQGIASTHPAYATINKMRDLFLEDGKLLTNAHKIMENLKYMKDKTKAGIKFDATPEEKAIGALMTPIEKQMDDMLRTKFDNYRKSQDEYMRITEEIIDPRRRAGLENLEGSAQWATQKKEFFGTENINPESIRRVGKEVSKQDPTVMPDVLRKELDDRLNKAMSETALGGISEWSGPKFRKLVVGNKQQAENLREMFRFIPNGLEKWKGFNTFLNVMKAQGKRLAAGSSTKEKQALAAELAGQGIAGAKRPGGVIPGWSALTDKLSDNMYRKNSQELANLLLSSQAEPVLRRLAGVNPKGIKGAIFANQILNLEAKGMEEPVPERLFETGVPMYSPAAPPAPVAPQVPLTPQQQQNLQNVALQQQQMIEQAQEPIGGPGAF